MKNRLKEIRLKKNLSQVELSAKSGVSRTIISQIENNDELSLHVSTLEKLCKALDEKITDIFFIK